MTPEDKLREERKKIFKGAVFDPQGSFLGYEPKSMGRSATDGDQGDAGKGTSSGRQGSGWGVNHDQPNPIIKLGKRLWQDASETVGDIKDEPGEVPYRIRERFKSYFPTLKERYKP